MTTPGDMEELARRIAEYANKCCNRSDGYEEDILRFVQKELNQLTLPQADDEAARRDLFEQALTEAQWGSALLPSRVYDAALTHNEGVSGRLML